MWNDDTDDPWKTWFVKIEDVLWAVTVDLSLLGSVGTLGSRLPICTRVRMAVRDNQDWFLTDKEAEAVDRLVDGLDDRTNHRPRWLRSLFPSLSNEVRFVGRRVCDGECCLYWYSSRQIRRRDFAALAAHAPGQSLSVEFFENPTWSIYHQELHPGAALSPLMTSWAQLRERKREYGEDLVEPREVSHTLYFGDEEGRARFIAASPGWEASTYESEDAPDGRRFMVILSGLQIIAQMASDPYIVVLSQRAESFGGAYDGWGSMVVGVDEEEQPAEP